MDQNAARQLFLALAGYAEVGLAALRSDDTDPDRQRARIVSAIRGASHAVDDLGALVEDDEAEDPTR